MTIPRSPQGQLDISALQRHLLFLADKGISGVALNGATSEYCLTTEVELTQILRTARKALGARATILAGIGGANDFQSLQLLAIAEQEHSDGVLLPMPHYFPYAQEDLSTFVESVAAKASIPVLLYNLPSFTSPLEPVTATALIGKLEQVIGIKDSSGQLDTVRRLTAELPQANRIIGNDDALFEALEQHLCDGVISGVACVLPELMLALYHAAEADPTGTEALRLRDSLTQFIGWLNHFPVPWGIKIIAQERGLATAVFPMPLSIRRAEDQRCFLEWFSQNRSALLADDSLKLHAK